MLERLSLSEALETGRLVEFVAQEEARGVESVDRDELDEVLTKGIKPPRSADRTSHSPSRDGSAET